MKPYIHAVNSVRKYGGKTEDYQAVHDFFDSSKAHVPDIRHRALLHSSFGIYMVEQVFGTTLTNSDGKVISIRDIGEDHVFEDMGFIPTVEKWIGNIPIGDWMWGAKRGKIVKHVNFDNIAPKRDDD